MTFTASGSPARTTVARQRRRVGNGAGRAAHRAAAGGQRGHGAEPGEAGGAGGFAAAPAARLPLREGLVLGLHPGRARHLLHRAGAGPRPRCASQPPLQVLGGGRGERGGLRGLGRRDGGVGARGAWKKGLRLESLAVPRGLRSVSHGVRARVALVADSLNCVEWSLLPPATVEMMEQAALLKGLFQGDPSFEYEYAEVNAEDDERFLEDGKEVNTAKHFPALFAAVVYPSHQTDYWSFVLNSWWVTEMT